MSQITTHILDTSLGKPAAGVAIQLQISGLKGWETIASGLTNSDGRLSNLLPAAEKLKPDTYSLLFQTGAYFQKTGIRSFYPHIRIDFKVEDEAHYHVPLLLNPWGFSTYRGS
jgi:hydroxyisourate hydrolase